MICFFSEDRSSQMTILLATEYIIEASNSIPLLNLAEGNVNRVCSFSNPRIQFLYPSASLR